MLRHVSNPPNPWARDRDVEYLEEIPTAHVEVFEDHARTILARHDPAKVGFEFGINPYRGCQHACAYCEARRRHELLGFGAGTDFDTKIVVKPRAPELLREAFAKPSWKGDLVVFSTGTDCYLPLEASYQLTRRCLEICAEHANPVAIVTKGALIERDIDLLTRIRDVARATITVSIPIWNVDAARALEPFVPTPARRMRTIRRLAEAGLDVGLAIAPLIRGLGEDDLGDLLAEAKSAGATRVTLSYLRLPPPVDTVFEARLRAVMPLRADRILKRVGEDGPFHAMSTALYERTCRRLGLPHSRPGDDRANTPAAPPRRAAQLALF